MVLDPYGPGLYSVVLNAIWLYIWRGKPDIYPAYLGRPACPVSPVA